MAGDATNCQQPEALPRRGACHGRSAGRSLTGRAATVRTGRAPHLDTWNAAIRFGLLVGCRFITPPAAPRRVRGIGAEPLGSCACQLSIASAQAGVDRAATAKRQALSDAPRVPFSFRGRSPARPGLSARDGFDFEESHHANRFRFFSCCSLDASGPMATRL